MNNTLGIAPVDVSSTDWFGESAALSRQAKPLTFSCIVADPPWEVKAGPRSLHDANEKSRALEYPTMSVPEIAALRVPAAKDAHLYMWTINAYLEASYGIARAWGFEPSTVLVWLKQPKGRGLGGTFGLCTEYVLFARRGSLPATSRCERNWWGWGRKEHSQKPEEFQTIIERVSPGPYLEMFARRKRLGWLSWGNEIESDVEINTGAVAPAPDSPNEKLCHGREENL